MRDSKEGGVWQQLKQGRYGGERLTHQYISIYSFGRRLHGSSESLLMLLLVYLAREREREREADGEKEKENTDDCDHQNTFVLEITSLVALLL